MNKQTNKIKIIFKIKRRQMYLFLACSEANRQFLKNIQCQITGLKTLTLDRIEIRIQFCSHFDTCFVLKYFPQYGESNANSMSGGCWFHNSNFYFVLLNSSRKTLTKISSQDKQYLFTRSFSHVTENVMLQLYVRETWNRKTAFQFYHHESKLSLNFFYFVV